MPLDELTITLSEKDGRLGVQTLVDALENALAMLKGLESDIVASGIKVRWEVVRISMKSPLRFTIAPRIKGRAGRTSGRKIVKACLQGMREIEKTPEPPIYFNDDSLEAAKKLVKAAGSDGASLTISSNGQDKITLTEKAVRHIEEIASKARKYMDFSTIEGRLEIISVHVQPSFAIWEMLTNYRIECHGSEEHMAQAMSLLGKRVAVTGRVSYSNHKPKSIQVESMKGLREINELPQPKDIGPIDITGDLSSEEHIRRMRNA
jgi:hypothetical protein